MAEPETLADVLATNNGEGPSSNLRARLSTPEITQYLTHLTSLSLPEIVHEPTTLASEASQLTNSLTSLCHAEYPTFLSLHRTSSVLSSSFTTLSSSLNSLLSALPALESSARQFTQETHTIQDARTKARKVLSAHDALIDILDVPQLIDTCVRSSYYQEAMDLAAHASRLAQSLPDVPIVQDVNAEASHSMRLMLAQLLARLREPAKLPALFKAVSFLRKMCVLEEKELALVFLTSRLVNLNAMVEGIEKERTDHARYVRKYVDVWREGVSDVITQYTTIFLERAPTSSDSNAAERTHELRYLLSALTHHQVSSLLTILRTHLSHITDATSLSALLTQLTHCGAALARSGLDFRSLLPPLFEHAVQVRFSTSLEAATDAFIMTLSDAKKYRRQPSNVLCTPAAASSPPEDVIVPEQLHVPPHILASYPPLAIYTNAILTALNSLRLLAPSSLLTTLLSTMADALTRASSEFLQYSQSAVETATTEKAKAKSRIVLNEDEEPPDQERIVRAAGKVFVRLLVPYVRRALVQGVYGVERIDEFDAAMGLNDSLTQWDAWLDPPNTIPETN
ncbi:Dor1-domain-containing protein [Fomitiporia mediterranea MF3/22]|uniref:Dor1-domain-containing protein n=1 Tax=Fomitiporia mediterranea (strain MF3/22) TaxID=694068 RepID=UPI000440783D|nr:Dor1-domain-containing protein [Fomitiporia mediterranea MF3/22]EJD03485.1 Dor1-domain-containing protein [Fomitiporia mediterranea MF3/22]